MGLPKSVRMIEVQQQVKYGFNEKYVVDLLSNFPSVDKYAWIIHDKCTKNDGTLKESHLHLMLHFSSPYPVEALLAKLNGVCSVQHLERIKGRWNSAIAYLTHENAPGKHRYSRECVHANYDINEDIEDALSANKDARKEEIISGIASGKIRRYNLEKMITNQEYVKYKRDITTSFEYETNKRIHGRKDREMEVLFITGGSGYGKTSFAKQFCEDHELSYFVSSGSNDVLDGYADEDVLILDDLRPSCLGLSDLLKLTDNNTSSSVKSRYYNKVLYCKYIIITTTRTLEEFYKGVFEHEEEPIKQLKRRCKTYYVMYKKTVECFVYSKSNNDYISLGVIPNPMYEKYREIEKNDPSKWSDEEKAEYLRNLLGKGSFLGGFVDKVKQSDGFLTVDEDTDLPF